MGGHFIRQGDMEGRDCTCDSSKCDDASIFKPLGKCYPAIKWMILEAWTTKGLPYVQDYKDYGLTRGSLPSDYQAYLHDMEPTRGCPKPCPKVKVTAAGAGD